MAKAGMMVSEEVAALVGIHEEAGWTGAFTRHQADGAIPNDTPVEKVKGDIGDCHDLGKTGIILGSFRAPGVEAVMYFVEWHDMPKMAFGVIDWKIAPLKQ